MATSYINGNVYTVDPNIPHAEAFLVNEDGTFGAVGSTAEIQKLGAKVIDLNGQFVMPGMHDAHSHVLLAAQEQLFQAKLGGIGCSADETMKKLKQYAGSCQHLETVGNWLVGHFYHYAHFKDQKPDRKFLDDAFRDQRK